MKIVISGINDDFTETISVENLDNIDETFKKFSSIKEPLKVKIFAINKLINSHKLSTFKNNFHKFNICSLSVYSNTIETIIAGKSLKINSTFAREQEIKNKLYLLESNNREDTLHEGTVRSGDRISSNGNLFVIGDVNPGAIISAKKNIYVWGKLLGIAFAGNGGNKNAYITSLYLSPLQLRIADVVAIGPKEKPKNNYPEIAVVNKQTIDIRPYIMETKIN